MTADLLLVQSQVTILSGLSRAVCILTHVECAVDTIAFHKRKSSCSLELSPNCPCSPYKLQEYQLCPFFISSTVLYGSPDTIDMYFALHLKAYCQTVWTPASCCSLQSVLEATLHIKSSSYLQGKALKIQLPNAKGAASNLFNQPESLLMIWREGPSLQLW